MKLSIRAVAGAFALIWGILGMGLVGLSNLIWPAYGREFLQVMASVYPAYHAMANFGQVVVGAMCGLVDGAIAGALFAWLYNLLLPKSS